MPSIVCGLVLWGACCDSDIISSNEKIHCQAARIIFNLPKDMAFGQVLNFANWITIRLNYKVEIFKLFYNANNDIFPSMPRCNSRLMRDSLAFRRSALWNLVNYNDKIDHLYFKEIKRLLITKWYLKTFFSTVQLSPHLDIEMVILCIFRNV